MKVCIDEVVPVEMLKGVFRRTLAHNDNIMLVHFEMKMGSKVPAHSHKSDQVGIVLEGEMQLFIGDETYSVKKGDSYCIPSHTVHGATMTTDIIAIDIFSPARENYKPTGRQPPTEVKE